jgi:D-alanyl-D-alanine carboxypeptidase
MDGFHNDSAGRLRGRGERKPAAAAVIAVVALVSLAAVACGSGTAERPPSEDQRSGTAPSPEASPSGPAASFPTAAFADISEDPVSEEVAAKFQAALRDMAGEGGIAATVMSPDGTWSGAAGKADGVRDVRVDDQFAIGSVTKPVIAAQVMQMVEAGELDLDDPATDHLPPDLDFDSNGATIRQLLGHRSGIPDYYPRLLESLSTDRQRVWLDPALRVLEPADLLALVPDDRAPAGEEFGYTDTNYLLLGLVIEQIRGRPIGDVLRDGVLSIDGVERLIYQPDEVPTEPIAMPYGESTAALKQGGGYLPSLAAASADGAAAAMASDAPSLARWWRALCAGEIVSQASLTEMSKFQDGYGLGLINPADPYAQGVGHTGDGFGDSYVSWAGCLPDDGTVVVVLTNRWVDDQGGMARPLVLAARPD